MKECRSTVNSFNRYKNSTVLIDTKTSIMLNVRVNAHLVLRKHAFPRICAFDSFDRRKGVHTARKFAQQMLEKLARKASLQPVMPVVDRCIVSAARNSANQQLGGCFLSQLNTLKAPPVLCSKCWRLESLRRAVLQRGTSNAYVVVHRQWLCMVQEPDLTTA